MSVPSAFEIIGPVMVGPSSSHTGGAARMGFEARRFLGEDPDSVEIVLYGSYARTCRGHKTDVALVGGCLGFPPDDERIRDSFEEAKARGIEVSVRLDDGPCDHPNTAVIELQGRSGRRVRVKGASIGGGSIRIESAEALRPGPGFEEAPESADGSGTPISIPDLETCEELIREAERRGSRLSDVVLDQESAALGCAREEVIERAGRILEVMRKAVKAGLRGGMGSIGGLANDDAARAWKSVEQAPFCGPLLSKAVAWALAVSETNAAMGVVAAAPTGGACGALPGAVLATAEVLGSSDDDVLHALLTAGGIGARIAAKSSLSGSVAGCQVEAGVAAGMAAAAVAQLAGCPPRRCADAAAIAIKAFLGLGCDAIAGLVEVPCIKRNAVAAAGAIAAAFMASAGIESQVPLDEVIWALADTGRHIPFELRDTMRAGLACTPTGRAVFSRLYGKGE